MLEQTVSSWIDYFTQLARLLCDPIFVGREIVKGLGQPVLLLPGFFTGDSSMLVMMCWLERMGYRPYASGIDLNVGCPDRKAKSISWRLDYIAGQTGRPVVVIGHSLGGVLARNLAVTYPEVVSHVITLGSPVYNDLRAITPTFKPAFAIIRALWRLVGNGPEECGSWSCECGFARTAAEPLLRPNSLTALYTREDEVVDWRACVDSRAENLEVRGGHNGLLVNPQVYRLLAALLVRHAPPDTKVAA